MFQIQHILYSSILSETILRTEIYTFRHGSLIVYFRFYANKAPLDQLLDIRKSKTIINLYTVENVVIDDQVLLDRLQDTIRRTFENNRKYLQRTQGDIVIETDTLKITSIDRLQWSEYETINRNQIRIRLLNETSYKANIVTRSEMVSNNSSSKQWHNKSSRTNELSANDHTEVNTTGHSLQASNDNGDNVDVENRRLASFLFFF